VNRNTDKHPERQTDQHRQQQTEVIAVYRPMCQKYS